MKIDRWLALPLLILCVTATNRAAAQDSSADAIESLFSAEEEAASQGPSPEEAEKASDAANKSVDVKGLSDLAKLAPFEDVAVIQKRYLPKTQRFEIFAGGTGVLNDAFFLSAGGTGRIGYYFKERWGIEAVALILNTSEKQVTSDLRTKRGVFTQSLVTAKSYYGLDVKWTPIYGKMTWGNHSITPFDLYFSLGGGMTGTNQDTSEGTIHLGTGQVFALSKMMALRWDFSWNFFNAQSSVKDNASSSLYNNLFLTIGVSFFFPEATYR